MVTVDDPALLRHLKRQHGGTRIAGFRLYDRATDLGTKTAERPSNRSCSA
jgi:hypothetical protein